MGEWSMRTWEYRKMLLTESSRRGDEVDVLCDLGAEGWELVVVLPNGVAYFKRDVERGVARAEQLLDGAGQAGAPPLKSTHVSEEAASVRPKYRDPTTGDTWSGRGRMASWLKRKVDAGEDPQTYLI